MSQIFDEKGNVIPVTLIEAGPCFVTQIKEKSVQIGFEKLKVKKIKKTLCLSELPETEENPKIKYLKKMFSTTNLQEQVSLLAHKSRR